MELKRVLLKLSGEALAGDKKTGFDEATVKEVARQVKTAVDDGIEVEVARAMQSIGPRRIRSECWQRS